MPSAKFPRQAFAEGVGSAPIEARDFALGLAELDLCFQVVALIRVGLAFSDPDLDLHLAVFPIHPQAGQGGSFDRGGLVELENLLLVNEQATGTAGFVLEPASRGFPRLNVAAIEQELAAFDTRVGVRNVDLPSPDRFDLGAFQLDSCLVGIRDIVVPACLAVA